jgi:hypothetical protein
MALALKPAWLVGQGKGHGMAPIGLNNFSTADGGIATFPSLPEMKPDLFLKQKI